MFDSIRSITKLTPTTKNWPDYDRAVIDDSFFKFRIPIWPLWPYPQAFEFEAFRTTNRWFLQNLKVTLFSCCYFFVRKKILRPQLCYSVLNKSITSTMITKFFVYKTSHYYETKESQILQQWKPPNFIKKSRKKNRLGRHDPKFKFQFYYI